MKLNRHTSLEALLNAVDTICIPSSREGLGEVYSRYLSVLFPNGALPAASELVNGKHGNLTFFAKWNDRHLKVLIHYGGEQITAANAYSGGKRLGIRTRHEAMGRVGLLVAHYQSEELLQSVIAGFTAGLYDLGLFKKPDPKGRQPDLSEFELLLPEG